ncbi:MAG: response regulator [Lachnospiraceae bacterium]|nr:response regulator [Lachnospiraceae bacterium]
MQQKVLFTAGKETFVVRVLTKKIEEMGMECLCLPCEIESLKNVIDEVSLISVYLDDDNFVDEDTIQYMTDHMAEKDGRFILIGEQSYINTIKKNIPDGLIYKEFPRPVNNNDYAKAVKEYFTKESRGELKKRILIIDDDPQYLNLVREWLKDIYKVSLANSGLQGIKFLGKNKVDLILLDYEMPITTGPQVLEMLRNDDETKSIPVMFLTSKSDKKSVMEVVELRPEAYFLKTIQKDELIEKLTEYFINKK